MNRPVKHTKEQLRLKRVERNIEITKNLLSGKKTVNELAETHGVVKMQINAITLAVIRSLKIVASSKGIWQNVHKTDTLKSMTDSKNYWLPLMDKLEPDLVKYLTVNKKPPFESKPKVNTNRDIEILECLIKEEATYKDTAKKFNISPPRVKQIYMKQIRILREVGHRKGMIENRFARNVDLTVVRIEKEFWLSIIEVYKELLEERN